MDVSTRQTTVMSVVSTSNMAGMKTCSRERASSAPLDHEVHQRMFLSSPSHKKHTNNSRDQSNVLKMSADHKARFSHMEGTKMGQRFSIYLFIQAEFSFTSHNTVATVISALSHILENPTYPAAIPKFVPIIKIAWHKCNGTPTSGTLASEVAFDRLKASPLLL